MQNPAELPASWSNSGAGTEKRPKRLSDSTGRKSRVKQKIKKDFEYLALRCVPVHGPGSQKRNSGGGTKRNKLRA